MDKKLAFSLCLVAALTWGCSDESSSSAVDETPTCAADCVNCVDGVCKDEVKTCEASCVKCENGVCKDEVKTCEASCVKCENGVCKDEKPEEKICDPTCGANYICKDGECVGDTENHSCSKCEASETCIDSACINAEEACAACGSNTKCVGGICYDVDSETHAGCLNCSETQVCRNNICYDATDFCATCAADEECVNGSSCKKLSNPCLACSAEQSCVDSTCVACTSEICGGVCCEEGYGCDLYTGKCEAVEFDKHACNGTFCADNEVCSETGECKVHCEDERDACDGYICCAADRACSDDTYCKLTCEGGSLCGKADPNNNYEGEFCCDAAHVCEEDMCKTKCADDVVRCGSGEGFCCDVGEVCVFGKCLEPTSKNECTTDRDCDFWSTCDVNSKRCVSADEDDSACIYNPPVGEFAPRVKWHYKDVRVENTPAVADINGDGVPEVVFTNMNYELIVLNGSTGAIIAKSKMYNFNDYDGMALADVDNDGKIEIIATTATTAANSSGMVLLNLNKVDGNWTLEKKAFFSIADSQLVNSSSRYWVDIHPAVADIDSDGIPEIVTTRGIVKGNDLTKWQCTMFFPSYSAWYQYGFVIADLDQDGQSEIIGHKMYDNKCNMIMDEAEASWGFTAVADLLPEQTDPKATGELVPEIVRVKSLSSSNGYVSVWKVYKKDGKWTQEKKWETKHPGGGGGHPNIADFDGDKKPEIGLAGGSKYAVFKGDTGTVLWSTPTNDSSSYRTGSSVFDFEGDGKAEVVYRDQCYLRIYNGSDGKVLWETPATSGTVLDYPLIVDVDNNGRTEIITTSSYYSCGSFSNSPLGVIAYEDTYDNWVRTRTIWNQHTYHVTNINDDGTVPQYEEANWLNSHLNNYRENIQPTVNLAPDFIAVDFKYSHDNCKDKDAEGKADPRLLLTATIKNAGSLGISDEVGISFYIENYIHTDGKKYRAYLGSVYTKESIAAGATASASLKWDMSATITVDGTAIRVTGIDPSKYQVMFSVDDGGSKDTYIAYHECHEENNDSSSYPLEACPVEGEIIL